MREALKPYLVPALDREGRQMRVVLMATPEHMTWLMAREQLVIETGQAVEALTLKEHADLIAAKHERDAFLQDGGVLL